MKKLLFSLLFALPLIAMEEGILQIQSPALQYPSSLGSLKLYHHQDRFFMDDNGNINEIQRCDIDPQMRKMTKEQMLAYLATGYIKASKTNNGDVILRAHQRLNGGGLGGATAGFFIGKFVTHFVAQVGIGIATAGVAIVCPPAAVPFFYAAEATVAPVVEAVSNTIALGTGIAAAVATGPV